MTRRAIITAGATALALAAAVPSVASATDYCVAPKTDCGANNVSDLETALTKAHDNVGPDRVLLTEGTYVAQAGTGFSYPWGDPVEIVGAGRGKTILTGPPQSTGQVLTLLGFGDHLVQDLTIRIPAQVKLGFSGLYMRATARRIDIVENPDQSNQRRGVRIDAPGVLEDSSVTLGSGGTVGAWMTSANVSAHPGAIRHSVLSADNAVFSDQGGIIERSYLTGATQGVWAQSGATTIANSVVRATKDGGVAVTAVSDASGATVQARGTTIVGPSTGTSTGVATTTYFSPNASIHLDLADSIVRAARPLYAFANGNGDSVIAVNWSDYDPSTSEADGVHAKIDAANVQNAGDARFVNADAGDYRLVSGSPMVDAGDPASADGLDLDGNPLVADGNADGIARRDLGAYELQPPAPQPQADTQAPVITGFRARRSAVSYRLSERARVTVKLQRRLAGKRARYRTLGKAAKSAGQGANRLKLTRRLRARAAHPGRYRAVIVAIDAAGNRSAQKAATFRVKR